MGKAADVERNFRRFKWAPAARTATVENDVEASKFHCAGAVSHAQLFQLVTVLPANAPLLGKAVQSPAASFSVRNMSGRYATQQSLGVLWKC
jgi:hypothetical protein